MLYTNSFVQNTFILFIDLCLENKDMSAGHFACLVTDSLEKMAFKTAAKVTFWRPFCLCKLDGQELKIPLGNRDFRIQHTQIRLKSLVPNFYSKMPLTFTFLRNLTSLCREISSELTNSCHTEAAVFSYGA